MGFATTGGAGDSVLVLTLLLLSSSGTAGAATVLVDGVATDTLVEDEATPAVAVVVCAAVCGASDLGEGDMFWRMSADSEEAEEGTLVAREEGL